MKSLRNPDWRPTHPGAVLREDILPALKMTQWLVLALLQSDQFVGVLLRIVSSTWRTAAGICTERLLVRST